MTSEESFTITEKDRKILGRDKEVLNATIQIVGRLDMVSFSAHRGAIVSDSESFPVTWDEEIRSSMQKLADIEGVIFKVKPVIDHSRLNDDAIGFHVLECKNPHQKLEL